MRRIGVLSNQLLASQPCSGTCSGDGGDKGALFGIRVVELATVLATPLCGALLADYGAEVIKIEDPKNPDVTRSWGSGDDPNKTADPALNATVERGGSSFVQLNRGKKSIVLDPSTEGGMLLLKRLLRTADIFITNVRLRSLRKLGLDYEALQPEFPRLIYGHLSAYGRAGKMVDDPGYDFGAFWAQTGLMDICRSSDDAPMPREPGGIGDYNTGMQLLGGIFAALFHRERTGQGQLVDACLMRAGIWSMGQPLTHLMGGNGWATGSDPRSGQMLTWGIRGTTELGARGSFTTKAPFKCKNGAWIQLLGNDVARHMPKMHLVLGVSPETLWGTDMRNIDWVAANRVADAIFEQKTLEEWEPILRKHDVWYTPVHRFEDQRDPDSLAFQQAKAVGSYVQAPGISRHDLLATPVQLSNMPAKPRAPAPRFGEHNLELLQGELKLSEEELAKFTSGGVLGFSKGLRVEKTTRQDES